MDLKSTNRNWVVRRIHQHNLNSFIEVRFRFKEDVYFTSMTITAPTLLKRTLFFQNKIHLFVFELTFGIHVVPQRN